MEKAIKVLQDKITKLSNVIIPMCEGELKQYVGTTSDQNRIIELKSEIASYQETIKSCAKAIQILKKN